jgi:hypothetical protein
MYLYQPSKMPLVIVGLPLWHHKTAVSCTDQEVATLTMMASPDYQDYLERTTFPISAQNP